MVCVSSEGVWYVWLCDIWGFYPYSGTAKKEEAADLFVRAANAYKVGKRYKGEKKVQIYMYSNSFSYF